MTLRLRRRGRRANLGATMVEYVLTCALIGVVAISAMKFLGSSAGNKLNDVSGNVTNSQ